MPQMGFNIGRLCVLKDFICLLTYVIICYSLNMQWLRPFAADTAVIGQLKP